MEHKECSDYENTENLYVTYYWIFMMRNPSLLFCVLLTNMVGKNINLALFFSLLMCYLWKTLYLCFSFKVNKVRFQGFIFTMFILLFNLYMVERVLFLDRISEIVVFLSLLILTSPKSENKVFSGWFVRVHVYYQCNSIIIITGSSNFVF